MLAFFIFQEVLPTTVIPDYPAMSHWGQHKAIPGIDYVLSFVSMFDNPKFATIKSGVSVFQAMLPRMDTFRAHSAQSCCLSSLFYYYYYYCMLFGSTMGGDGGREVVMSGFGSECGSDGVDSDTGFFDLVLVLVEVALPDSRSFLSMSVPKTRFHRSTWS